uniref:Uncharacterized protein n=1 Tax=Aegilops tauschii subsp. strangulata TaxID=200361 RepID=A0A453MZU1_AEGTS
NHVGTCISSESCLNLSRWQESSCLLVKAFMHYCHPCASFPSCSILSLHLIVPVPVANFAI